MTYSDYPNGFEHGVTIRNIPIDIAVNPNANVFWVDSVIGSDGNRGTPKKPFATLAYAITQCVADQGDIIYLAAGHVETVISAAAINFNVNGITVIFLGEGTNKATIQFTTATNASISITGNNITFINPRFLCGIDALTTAITVTGVQVKLLNVEWYDAPAKATVSAIQLAATANNSVIDGWKYYASTTGTQKQSHIEIIGTTLLEIRNVDIRGDFSVGNINNDGTPAASLLLENLFLRNINSTPKPGLVLISTTSGIAKNIDIRIVSGTTYVSSVARMNWDNNCLGYSADGYSGRKIGTAASGSVEDDVTAIKAVTDLLPDAGALTTLQTTATNILNATAAGGGSNGTALDTGKSLVDALGSNGTSLLYGSGSILGAIGTTFWIKKTVTSSAITFAAPVDITAVSSGGELAIEQVILKTDSTGLATGTNFQLLSNNANGLANILVEAIANLGGNKTITLDNASVTKIKTVLETGKKLQVQNTVADGTGAGTVDIYVQFRRLAAGATVAAL